MAESPQIGSMEWLRANALFGCQVEYCSEEISWTAENLRVHNGKPVCETCWDERVEWDPSVPAVEFGEDGEEIEPAWPDWHELQAFNPFPACEKGRT